MKVQMTGNTGVATAGDEAGERLRRVHAAPANAGLTIGELATSAGVGVETIRFYQRRGLVPEPPRRAGSIRRYGATEVERLRFVKSAQSLGFSLDEVAELLRLEDGAHCKEASALAETKLADIRRKLAELSRMDAALSGLVKACHARRGKVSCPLIAAFHGDS